MVNPLPKAFVVSQCTANLQAKRAGICVYKTRYDPSITTVSVYEVQIGLPHFPGLLDDLFEYTIPDDLGWVVSV